MQEPPPNTRRTEESSEVPDKADQNVADHRAGDRQLAHGDHRTFKEAVETAATAYFAACRKIARTINRLKHN